MRILSQVMSPPSAAVEFGVHENYKDRARSSDSPYCQSGVNPVIPSGCGLSLDGYATSYESGQLNSGFTFSGCGRIGSNHSVRSKARLVKMRKGFGGKSSGSSLSSDVYSSSKSSVNGSLGSDQLKYTGDGFQGSFAAEINSQSDQSKSYGLGRNSKFFNVDQIGVKFVDKGENSYNMNDAVWHAKIGAVCKAGELGGDADKSVLDEEPRWRNMEYVVRGETSLGSNFQNRGPSSGESLEEKVELVNDRESLKFNMAGFVFGSSHQRSVNALRKKGACQSRRRVSVGCKTRANNRTTIDLHKPAIFYSNRDFSTSNSVGCKKVFEDVAQVQPEISKQPFAKPCLEEFVYAAGESVASNEIHDKEFKDFCASDTACGDGKKRGSQHETSSEVNLSCEMQNLNINNFQKVVQPDDPVVSGTGASTNPNNIFLFGSSGIEFSFSSIEPTTSSASKHSLNADIKCAEAGVADGGSSHPASRNTFIFGTSENISSNVETRVPNQVNGSNISGTDHGEWADGQHWSFKVSSKEKPHLLKDGENVDFSFSCTSYRVEASRIDFSKFSFAADMHNNLDGKSGYRVKSKVSKDYKRKKTIRRATQNNLNGQKPLREPLSERNTHRVMLESSGCDSPMDSSPYEKQENTSETRPTCPERNTHHMPCTSKGDKITAALFANSSAIPFCTSMRFETAPGSTGSSTSSNHSDAGNKTKKFMVAASTSQDQPSLMKCRQKKKYKMKACHLTPGISSSNHSNAGNIAGKFMFTASTSQEQPSSIKCRQKKYRMKACHISPGISTVGTLPLSNGAGGANGHLPTLESRKKLVADKEEPSLSSMTAAEKACERWRMRGNEAYKKGELSEAEVSYTWGINCIPSGKEASGSSVELLVLCYSNRAATRMALGRIRDSIQDCLSAITLDPSFVKARIRAANCHLMLGECEDAIKMFQWFLKSGGYICLDRHIVISASEGLQKAQKVTKHTSHSEELLKQRSSEAAVTALNLVTQGLSVSSCSEKLLELKADALLMLERYEEVMLLCHQTLDFAEKNFGPVSPKGNGSSSKHWRVHILAKCYFYLGKIEAALKLFEKQENFDSSNCLAITIGDLLKHKSAGNEAFKSGKHAEAVEHYTSAIQSGIHSRPFAAVCFGNRAAAHQALGQVADAIADCSFAIALDENYAKAASRRATLHEMIRDYKQAALDLERFVSIVEKKPAQSGSGDHKKELKQANGRLSSNKEEAKKELSLDIYLILGVKQTDTAADIKKAYRKAALKHHPDKAAQLLGRSENGNDGRCWKDIADSVRKDSDRLFKVIGEAYAIFSDPEKRSEYDITEEIRKTRKDNYSDKGSSRRRESDVYSCYHNSNKAYWQYWRYSQHYSFRSHKNSYY